MNKKPEPNEVDFLLDEFSKEALAMNIPKLFPQAAKQRLLGRVGQSRQRSESKQLARSKHTANIMLSSGVEIKRLYESSKPDTEHGEPSRVELITLSPGACHEFEAFIEHQLLVLEGSIAVRGQKLGKLDFHYNNSSTAPLKISTQEGAAVYVQIVEAKGELEDKNIAQFDSAQAWHAYGPGIERRVMRLENGHATVLYKARAGASVPCHRHSFAEQCFIVEGDLFLDDTLLTQWDYEFAPHASVHDLTHTENGAILLAHTDFDLQFIPPPSTTLN